MGEELAKLLEAEFIREIKHPDWLANLVMVPKKDKSWRLCVDFKDLNKACPKCRCGTTPMGSQESLLRLPGCRVARRAGLVISTRIVYPGSGREVA